MKIGYLMQEGVPDIWQRTLTGPANHVICVIQELIRAGHEVRLLAKIDRKIWSSDDLENFKQVMVPVMDQGPGRWLERVTRRLQSQFNLAYANYFESLRFANACQQTLYGYDVLYERMGWLGYGGGIASHRLKIPLVLEVNGDHLEEFRSQGLEFHKSQECLSFFLMKKAAQQTSHIVATGEGWREKYIERWAVRPSDVSVVENGSSLVEILLRENLRSFRPVEWGEPMRIAYCGGFEAWHGIPILVRAVCNAIRQGCDLRVSMIGSGAEINRVIDLIDELGLNGIFNFTGQVDLRELGDRLAQADVGISTYCGRVEFSGLKLFDYKAAGLATIASGQNGQPSSLEHGRTGWIVPPCNEVALTEAIITLARNPHLRTKIGQEARIEAESLHSWHHTAERLAVILAQVTRNYRRDLHVN